MKLKYIFLVTILLCSVFVATSTPADVYRPIHPSDNSLSGLVSATGDVSKMDYWFEGGRLYIDSEIHDTMNFKFNVKQAGSRFKGWNGQAVRLIHKTDDGVVDTSEIVSVESDGVWIYFRDVDFSTVIVDGYAGTTTKIDATISNNQTNLSYGQDLTNMTSVTVNITQGYTSELSKYDYITSLGPVLWLKADGNANATIGENGTWYGNESYDDGKHNESFDFDGFGSYVDVGSSVLNIQSARTVVFTMKSIQSTGLFGVASFRAGTSPTGINFVNNKPVLYLSSGNYRYWDESDLYFNNQTHLYIFEIIGVNQSDIQLSKMYIDNEEMTVYTTVNTSAISTWTTHLIGKTSYGFSNGHIDNVLIFNRTLNETERNNLYYDPVQELKFRTNSNTTWSDNWNSTANNSMDVNFGSGDVLTHLIKYMPTTATVDGVITRDYNTTAQFSMSSVVGFTEATTVISESAASNYFLLNISHQAGLNSSGYINHTTTNGDLLGAEWNGTAVLYSDNVNATLIYIEPTFYISTGVLNSGDEWQYNVTVPYGDMPSFDIDFSDYDFSSLGTIVNITLSNYTFGLTKVGFNFSENIDGVTYHWRYRSNYSEIMNLTASAHNETLEFMPDFPVQEGESYISRGEAPIITDWSNNITLNTSQDITINITESIEFNATADQTVSTWSWFKDGIDAVNDFYNYIISWLTGGSKTVTVNATNENGTSNTITWNITVNILPPQNLTSIPDIDHIHFDWDDYSSADYINISELEECMPYVNTSIVLDGQLDAVYNDSAHGYVLSSPNQVLESDYEIARFFRNDSHLMAILIGVDGDGLPNDDILKVGIDNTGDGLTADDRLFIINELGSVTAKRGPTWLPQATSAEAVVVGGGVSGTIHFEVTIPLSELSGFVNGITAKFMIERECKALNPTVETFYPDTLINDTDGSLWADALLSTDPIWNFIANTTSSDYNSENLTALSWYKHKFITINGTTESTAVYSTDITIDNPEYNVSGYVFDPTGSPVENVTVSVENGYTVDAHTTNASGLYTGLTLHNGSYTLSVNKTGYLLNSTNITVSGADLTNVNLTLIPQSLTVENLAVSPQVIKEGGTSTITVDVNETAGSITSVLLTIETSTYLMSATTGDTWSYTWTAPVNAPHKYTITQIVATGLYSTNTTNQSSYVDVISTTGSGGAGSGGIGLPDEPEDDIPDEPDADEPEEGAVVESIIDNVISTIKNTTGHVKNIFISKETAFIGVKYTVGDYSTTKEFAKPEALICEATDPRVSCGVMNGVLTIVIIPTTDDSKLYQLTDTYVQITNNDGNSYHLPVSLSLINLMWYFDFNLDTGIENPYIVAEGANTDKTIGLRGWWISMIAGLFMIGFVRKYK